jgi:hypothetical protein
MKKEKTLFFLIVPLTRVSDFRMKTKQQILRNFQDEQTFRAV